MAKPQFPPTPHDSSSKLSSDLIDPGCLHLTRWGMNRIPGIGNLSREERQEFEQEISLHVWKRLRDWDRQRGSLTTFIASIVPRKFIDLCRARTTKSPLGGVKLVSIDQTGLSNPADAEQGLSSELTGQDRLRHRGAAAMRSDVSHLQIDVTSVVSNLPDDLAQICRLLEHHSISEAARILGIPRATFYRRMESIRKRFEDSQLQAYL